MRFVLWLEEGTALTWRLRRQRRRGLEVRWVASGYGVHTKHRGYAASASAHRLPMVVCDDDIVYPPSWLSGLLAARARHPGHVVAFRCHAMRFRGDRLAPYTEWPTFDTALPSFAAFATSVSGQLLPPQLVDALRDAGDAFLESAPTADDVWLHRLSVEHGFRTAQVERHPVHFPFIPGSQTSGLNAHNVWSGGNDQQLARTHGPVLAAIRADAERDMRLSRD
ncbi:hypothetical protein [Agrococcus sp. Marseille-Q4369]|uniref:hypothetical protein n=1 Tax=Agrococcus sp. Marseille-Q4369 TaxID=2810513 RepID=UPI001B8C574F|nr:hypothetical protein [Agrococcus sp. Marseille-Q4369]QUW18559.1 hypothetical protein JSQ78_12290 [Agrococcus sp. Marseille-Q4369]